MCDLCSEDQEEREGAKQRERFVASRLRQLANHYDGVAAGYIKPHTKEHAQGKPMAIYVIRDLVEDWV